MKKLAPVDEVLIHEDGGEALLLNLSNGRYFRLNRTGVVVWKALSESADPVAAVAARWPDVAENARSLDVAELLKQLEAAGLVHTVDTS